MSHWNYRLCKTTYNKGEEYEEVGYEIREAYYNKDGGIWAVTEEAKGVYSDEGIDGVKQVLEWMKLALDKDIIDLDTFVFAKADFDKDDGIDWDRIDDPDFQETFAVELAALEEKDKEL